ncbi:anthrone oxygenase family protein [Pontimicrobium aquaticum]|uniref:DUF1772 domain-containing protein n=1 Tax=Pontimicrobium aquaticum TaxID=2565367 RepID=A0A4U0EVS9_9FLAO|nr:DUF1772 domain-containing protein [Pontimicrobium aquaticum]TJY35940.1 DUF1772 domain-containing protein [Pontimicrobium aquaticum]
MDITIQHIGIIALVLLTGLSAGLCFTWSNSITSGIGRLNDFEYLASFQQMNRTILNPLFFIVFFGPFFLSLFNLYVFKNEPSSVLWLLILAAIIYVFGVLLVTIFGNVPLNEMLDKTELANASVYDLKTLRNNFEIKWNRLHLVRTISSATSFIILIISVLQITKNNI